MEEKKTNVELFKEITKNMADLYEKKNANYGGSFSHNWDFLGPVAGLVPLFNKIDRLRSLIFHGDNHFESLEDTAQDLANYAVMFLIEIKMREGEPVLPLPKEVYEQIEKRMLKKAEENIRKSFVENTVPEQIKKGVLGDVDSITIRAK